MNTNAPTQFLFTGGKRDFTSLSPRIERWLRGTNAGFSQSKVLSVRPASESAGQANETYLMTVGSASDPSVRQNLIMRTSPSRDKAYFPTCTVEKQYRIMSALAAHSAIPVPRCIAYESSTELFGAPFYLMERVEGGVPPDSPPYTVAGFVVDADARQREHLWSRLVHWIAEVGKVDWRLAGLDFLDWPDSSRSRIEQHVQQWVDYRNWALEGDAEEHPHTDRIIDWLRRHAPAGEPSCLLWGDARFANAIVRDFEPVALLDWEVAQIGNPLDDLAYFLTVNFVFHSNGAQKAWCVPSLSGFSSEADTLKVFARLSGRSTERFPYYLVFNGFKCLSYMHRVTRVMLRAGAIDGATAVTLRRMPAMDEWIFAAMARA
jgi:aminoglycoside phosphotransferase (APT) family kinase protein